MQEKSFYQAKNGKAVCHIMRGERDIFSIGKPSPSMQKKTYVLSDITYHIIVDKETELLFRFLDEKEEKKKKAYLPLVLRAWRALTAHNGQEMPKEAEQLASHLGETAFLTGVSLLYNALTKFFSLPNIAFEVGKTHFSLHMHTEADVCRTLNREEDMKLVASLLGFEPFNFLFVQTTIKNAGATMYANTTKTGKLTFTVELETFPETEFFVQTKDETDLQHYITTLYYFTRDM